MANAISQALERLKKNILPLVKGYLLQEGAESLIAYYDDYQEQQTRPTKAKSGRLYFKEGNDGKRIRRLYGNITRALAPGGTGNITDVSIKNGTVVLVSGIDTTKDVKAGPDNVSLIYAQYQEEGTSTIPARPFLRPGFEDWNREELPFLLENIANDLTKIYNGR